VKICRYNAYLMLACGSEKFLKELICIRMCLVRIFYTDVKKINYWKIEMLCHKLECFSRIVQPVPKLRFSFVFHLPSFVTLNTTPFLTLNVALFPVSFVNSTWASLNLTVVQLPLSPSMWASLWRCLNLNHPFVLFLS